MIKAGLQGLDAYRNALDFYREVKAVAGGLGGLRDQLLRAARSVALNVAEAYPALGPDRARRFRIACDEASECGAALDLAEIDASLSASQLARLRDLLDRERAMLRRLSR